jgi:hypothetical protein
VFLKSIKDDLTSDDFSLDIKVFFDAIRNIGICAALILGLPSIELAMPVIFNCNIIKIFATSFTLGMVIGLYLLNLVWLFKSLKVRSKNKMLFMISSVIVIGLISLAVGISSISSVWGSIFVYA